MRWLTKRLPGWSILVLALPLRAQSPWAATQPAGPVGLLSATVNGMATPRGSDTAAWFEWGENSTYGSTTAVTNIGAGGRVIRISASVDGLVGGSIYHYRLAASNVFGITYGADNLLTTGSRLSTWNASGSSLPAIPAGLTNIVAQACGHGHSLAVTTDGTVRAWGVGIPIFYPNYGQTNVPADLTNVMAVAAGWEHSLALLQDGTVRAWGQYDSPLQPAFVPPGLSNVVAIAGGDSHSVALKNDGTVVAWGGNLDGQLSVPAKLTNVVAIAAGSSHSVALKADGTVVVWGNDPFAQPTTPPTKLSNVVAIASETWHNLALRSDGTVVAWGNNDYGKATVPAGLSNVIAVAAGFDHSLALKADGTLAAWGSSQYVTNVPSGLTNVGAISSGDHHSLAIAPGNLPPRAFARTVAGSTNQDIVVTLSGWDPNGDPVTFQVNPPTNGLLYQYTGSGRGSLITPDTVLSNISRVLFAPAQVLFAAPYATFDFVAGDGQASSLPATITVDILPPISILDARLVSLPAPGFVINFSGVSNVTYFVQAGNAPFQWARIGNATETSPGQFTFTDTSMTNWPARFYRVVGQ